MSGMPNFITPEQEESFDRAWGKPYIREDSAAPAEQKPRMRTFSNAGLADIIENDGIGYALEWAVDVERIEDPVTRGMWTQARTLLGAISQRCSNARAAAEDKAP